MWLIILVVKHNEIGLHSIDKICILLHYLKYTLEMTQWTQHGSMALCHHDESTGLLRNIDLSDVIYQPTVLVLL